MFSALLLGMEDWYSTRCRLIWKLKGTKYNRMYFQLQVSTLRTSGIESSLLLTPGLVEIAETPEDYQARQRKRTDAGLNQAPHPGNKYNCLTSQVLYSGMLLKTPSAMDAYAENLTKKEQTFGNSGTLAQEIQSGFVEKRWPGLLPTPSAFDFLYGRNTDTFKAAQERHKAKGVNLQITLKQMAKDGMLPTPATRDYKGAVKTETLAAKGRNHTNSLPDSIQTIVTQGLLPTPIARCWNAGTEKERPSDEPSRRSELNHLMAQETGRPSQLNPRFVAEMMGFPPNWTELPFQSGGTKASRDTGTP